MTAAGVLTATSAAAVALAVLCWPAGRILAPAAARPRAGRSGRVRVRRRGRRGAPTPADQVLQVLDMVAAQVRAGAAPAQAWSAALDVVDVPRTTAEPVADLVRWAGDASVAQPAQAAAAAWRLADTTGAPLADLLDSVCATLRAERADQAAVEAALAGPRATSRLLLALPVAGIGLGELIGASPVHVLWATPAGRACALTGSALLLVGRVWMRRQVASVAALAAPRRPDAAVPAGSAS